MEGSEDKWTFYKDVKGRWRWRRKAPNGEVVAAAHQGYEGLRVCVENAARCGYPESIHRAITEITNG